LQVSVYDVARFVNVTPDYLHRLFRLCLIMKREYYSLEHLEFVAKNLPGEDYRRLVIREKIARFVSICRDTSLPCCS